MLVSGSFNLVDLIRCALFCLDFVGLVGQVALQGCVFLDLVGYT